MMPNTAQGAGRLDPTEGAILELLAGHGSGACMTARQIAYHPEMFKSLDTVRKACARLVGRGLLENDGSGRGYRLADTGQRRGE